MSGYRILSSATTTNSSITRLFDDSTSEQQHPPSGYSARNDRPAASGNNAGNTYYRDTEDKQRTTFMITFLLVFMSLYIGFCFYCQRKRARVERDNNGVEGLSRREQLRDNQIVLDESIRATRRALSNVEAMIKYKQRKMNIENALYIRLLVTDDNCGPEQNDGLECVVIPQEDANKEHSAENASPPLSLPHHSTLSTTLATDLPSQPPKRHHLTIIPPTPSSENAGSRCDDECNICLNQFQVGDSVAWSMQYGKMVLPSAGSSSNMMCGGGSGTTMRDRFRICNNNCGDIPSSNDEYDVCKHVFHEACISRWLLVRDGCPTCRRSYFPSPAAVDNTFENETDLEQGFQNAQ